VTDCSASASWGFQ